jgi:hypothetical protein
MIKEESAVADAAALLSSLRAVIGSWTFPREPGHPLHAGRQGNPVVLREIARIDGRPSGIR